MVQEQKEVRKLPAVLLKKNKRLIYSFSHKQSASDCLWGRFRATFILILHANQPVIGVGVKSNELLQIN